MTTFLSVVVIGRNEGARLERCLQSIKAMRMPEGELEIIYVDSASVDASVATAERLGAKVVSVKPRRPTAALGRNAGWRTAQGSFILFLDGDTILDPSFVVNALADFTPEIAVVWGNRREIHPENSVFNRVLDLDWISPPGLVDYCGGDALIRRAVLEAHGGYDETLIAGEEPEMCRRFRANGWKILHVDRPMTGHDLAITRWSQYWKRATRTGYAYAEVSERFQNSELPFWEYEARHNRNRAVTLLGISVAALTATVLWRSPFPICAFVFFLVVLAYRTAGKNRWKSSDFGTRFLYGLHSHFQQIPIYIGQLEYRRDKRKGAKRELIEYKEVIGKP